MFIHLDSVKVNDLELYDRYIIFNTSILNFKINSWVQVNFQKERQMTTPTASIRREASATYFELSRKKINRYPGTINRKVIIEFYF